MCSPLGQASWAKRSHLSQRQSLTYVLEHKTVAYFFEFFGSENTRMYSTQERQATQNPWIRGFNELNEFDDFITFYFD